MGGSSCKGRPATSDHSNSCGCVHKPNRQDREGGDTFNVHSQCRAAASAVLDETFQSKLSVTSQELSAPNDGVFEYSTNTAPAIQIRGTRHVCYATMLMLCCLPVCLSLCPEKTLSSFFRRVRCAARASRVRC